MDGFAYLPGVESKDTGPLARYLPPVPDGVAGAFLSLHAAPGTWVLDPFGAAPALDVEMARAGYWVLVAVNNPVTRFLLDLAAIPPSKSDLRAALSELAAARKGEERMETHLQALYLTECSKCQRQVPAEAFIWKRDGNELVGRIYRCPCGESGEFPATEADKARARQIAATDQLHRARALERVAAPDDPDRQHAEEALECYPPRAVYALITLVNKLDGLSMPAPRRRALLALLLAVCDEANTLWPHPVERPRPKQLTTPPRFLEKNIWLALEHSVDAWSADQPIPTANWPGSNAPIDGGSTPEQTGGLSLFDGPIRDLAPHLKEVPLAAIVTALPRPNQAFWTLSDLWAGWLWGREAAASFKSVLRRRRYDWNWHATALNAALKALSGHVPLNAPLFALLPEPEPGFLSAALLAAAGAGFDLGGLAMRSRHDPIQIVWHRRAFSHDEKHKEEEAVEIDAEAVRNAMLTFLRERGEPAPYLDLHAAGLVGMAASQSLSWQEEALATVHAPIQAALATPEFQHHSASQTIETGLWGLSNWETASEPLPDRLEMSIVRLLQKSPGLASLDLEAALNNEFPGLQTPSLGLMRAVLSSYALEAGGVWSLRPEDAPPARRADLESTTRTLEQLASRLGYTASREETPRRIVRWQESGQMVYAFYLLASAIVGRLMQPSDHLSERCVLVLPGGRAGLLTYKLERDPGLRSAAERWRIVKFRHLRRLVELPSLTRERFDKELTSDPIEPPEQMKMF